MLSESSRTMCVDDEPSSNACVCVCYQAVVKGGGAICCVCSSLPLPYIRFRLDAFHACESACVTRRCAVFFWSSMMCAHTAWTCSLVPRAFEGIMKNGRVPASFACITICCSNGDAGCRPRMCHQVLPRQFCCAPSPTYLSPPTVTMPPHLFTHALWALPCKAAGSPSPAPSPAPPKAYLAPCTCPLWHAILKQLHHTPRPLRG